MKHLLLAAMFWCASTLAFAQKVVVVANLAPPYSPYPSNYALPENQSKLMLQVTSLVAKTMDIKVTFDLTSDVGVSLRLKDNFIPRKTFTLLPNETRIFGADDLRGYFRESDLIYTGGSKIDLLLGKPLPPGNYQCCVQVFDAVTNELLSAPTSGCTGNIFIGSLDPPMLTLPLSKSEVVGILPQNINFQWLKPAQALPDLDYEFILKEVPNNQIPQVVMSSIAYPTIYTATVNTLTMLFYGPDKPALEIGKTYAWRVQAVDTKQRYVFSNDGRSDAFSFKFQKPRVPTAPVVLMTPRVKDTVRTDAPFYFTPVQAEPSLSYRLDVKLMTGTISEDKLMDDNKIAPIFTKILRGGLTEVPFAEVAPKLVFGSRYAWRVTTIDDKDEMQLIADGKSAIHIFENYHPRNIYLKKPILLRPVEESRTVNGGIAQTKVPRVDDPNYKFKWAHGIDVAATFGTNTPSAAVMEEANKSVQYEMFVKKHDVGYQNPNDQMNTGEYLIHAKINVPNYTRRSFDSVIYQYGRGLKDKALEDQKDYVWYVRAYTEGSDKKLYSEIFAKDAERFKVLFNATNDTSKGMLNKRVAEAFGSFKKTDMDVDCKGCDFVKTDSLKDPKLAKKMQLHRIANDSLIYFGTMPIRMTQVMNEQEAIAANKGFGGANSLPVTDNKQTDKDLVVVGVADSSEYEKAAFIYQGEGIIEIPLFKLTKLPFLVMFKGLKVARVNGRLQALEGDALGSREAQLSVGTAAIATKKSEDVNTFPYGIPFKSGDYGFRLMFQDVRVSTTQTVLSVIADLDAQEGSGNTLALGASWCVTQDSICGAPLRLFLADKEKELSFSNGIKLSLLGDPLGKSINSTFIEFAKDDKAKFGMSFSRLHLAGKVTPSDLLLEASNDWEASVLTNKPVAATITTDVTSLRDWMFSINMPQFRVKGLDKISFLAKDVTVDLSTKDQYKAMKFPVGYFRDSINVAKEADLKKQAEANPEANVPKPDPEKEWQGLYISSATLFLHDLGDDPKEPLSIALQQVIIDKSGVSTDLELTNPGFASGRVGPSKLSLDTVRVGFRRAWFPRKLFIAGGLTIPVLDGALGFTGVWAKPDSFSSVNWRLAVNVKETLVYNLKMGSSSSGHFMQMAVAANSKIEVMGLKDSISYKNLQGIDKKRFTAVLNGWINVSIPESSSLPAVALPALTAENFTFQWETGKAPVVSGTFGVAGYPVFSGASVVKSSTPANKSGTTTTTTETKQVATTTPTTPATTPSTTPANNTTASTDTRARSNAVGTGTPLAPADKTKTNDGALNGMRFGIDPKDPPKMTQVGDELIFKAGILVRFGADTAATALTGGVGLISTVSYTDKGFDMSYKGLSSISLGFDGTVKEIVKLKADLTVFVADPIYGKGFSGKATGTFKMAGSTLAIDAALKIGLTKHNANEEYGYFYGSLGVTTSKGLPLGPVSLYGLSGGFFNNMKDTLIKVSNASVRDYTPAKDNIGFEVAPIIGLAKPETFNAKIKAAFNFNKVTGGLTNVTVSGDGVMMSKNFPANEKPAGTTTITATMDDNGFVLNGDVSMKKPMEFKAPFYVHILNKDSKWKFQVGDPYIENQRVKIQFNPSITAQMYLAMGNDYPTGKMPPIPTELTKFLSNGAEGSVSPQQIESAQGTLDGGPGGSNGTQIKLGARVNISHTGKVACIEYAVASVGGFDLNLMKSDAPFDCGSVKDAGINQWYANGQIYAYLKLTGSVAVDFGFWEGSAPFAVVEAGAMFQGGLPNPMWLRGMARVKGSVMGFDFNERVKIELGGVECYAGGAGYSLLSKIKVIESLVPANGAENVEPTAPVEAKFALPVNYEPNFSTSFAASALKTSLSIFDSKLNVERKFAVVVNASSGGDGFELFKGKSLDVIRFEMTTERTKAFFPIYKPYKSETEYTSKLRLYIYELEGGSWVYPKNKTGGRDKFQEEGSATFKIKKWDTDIAKVKLSDKDVLYTWPVLGSAFQPYKIGKGVIEIDPKNTLMNVYRQSTDRPFNFYVLLSPPDKSFTMQHSGHNGGNNNWKEVDAHNARYKLACEVDEKGRVVFNVPQDLSPNSDYLLKLMASDRQNGESIFYEGYFRTGSYATYEDKFKAWQLANMKPIVSPLGTINGAITYETKITEGLSQVEKPFVQITQINATNTTTKTSKGTVEEQYSRLLYTTSEPEPHKTAGYAGVALENVSHNTGWYNAVQSAIWQLNWHVNNVCFSTADREADGAPTRQLQMDPSVFNATLVTKSNSKQRVNGETTFKLSNNRYHRIYDDYLKLTKIPDAERNALYIAYHNNQLNRFTKVPSNDPSQRYAAALAQYNTKNADNQWVFFNWEVNNGPVGAREALKSYSYKQLAPTSKFIHLANFDLKKEGTNVRINYREGLDTKSFDLKLKLDPNTTGW